MCDYAGPTPCRTLLSLVQWLRENRATGIVVMLLLILTATVTCNLFRPRADARLDAMRRQGYPVTLSELDKWYPAVPDSQNNARIYERAFALPGFGNFDINWPDRGWALSAEDKEEWGELMASNQVALGLLHSAQSSN